MHTNMHFAELTIVDKIVMRGDCIVVPERLRMRMLEIAHEGHQGQVRTKQLLRPGGGGVLPYMGYIGTCRGIGYGFWRFSILK